MRRLAGVFSWLLACGLVCACTLRQPDRALTLVPSDLGTPVATAIQQAPTRTTIPPQLPTPTMPASLTPTRGITLESRLGASPSPRSTRLVTWTAVPDQPQFWTASPAAETTAIATSPPQRGFATPTPSPTATRFQPTVSVRRDLLREAIAPPTAQPLSLRTSAAAAFTYDVQAGQSFAIDNIHLSGGLRLFALNPTDSSSYVYTDQRGILRVRAPGAAHAAELIDSPFHAGYAMGIESIERNKHRVVEVDWSADGRKFSFRIDTPAGLDNSGAGVWFWGADAHPVHGRTSQVIRDCAHAGYRPCSFVNPSNARHWRTIGMQWSPVPGDDRILLTLHLPEESRNALAVARAVADPAYANDAPPMIHYNYGTWDLDAQHIIVSGRRPDGRVIVGKVNAALADEQVILDGSARGLWLRDAARLSTGEVVALGRLASGSGPLALYNQQGERISAFIGDSAPEQVRWLPDRSGVVLTVSGRQTMLRTDSGAIVDASELAGNPRFSQDVAEPAAIPAAVIRGASYFPGQQLRVIVGALNLRESPSTDAEIIELLLLGDYVAVFAGPYDDHDDDRWWQVQTAQNRFGWIAGRIAGRPTVGPA